MKNAKNYRTALLACFAVTLLPALSLGAQTPQPFSVEDLDQPDLRTAYTPQSGVNIATMGTIGADVDRFMSVFEFSRLSSEKYFGYVGIIESLSAGLNGGFGAKFGKVYFGIGYGGTAIGEVVRLIPNQDLIRKTSDNTLNVLVGAGIVGVKLGFSEFIRVTDLSGGDIQESSLKPSLELGFNLKAGSVGIKPAIRGAFDMHQYRSKTGNGTVTTQKRQNYSEPSAGITLELDFGKTEATQFELDLVGDAALRMYTNGLKNSDTVTTYEASDITDIRITGNPAFIFRKNFKNRVILAAKASAGIGYSIVKIPQFETSAPESEYTTTRVNLSINPDVSFGAQFNLIPDHFAIHGGLGIPVLTYSQTQMKTRDPAGSGGTETVTEMDWVPSARLAVGMMVNFTKNTALDLSASATGLGLETVDLTNFAVLFTIKK
jgi:hypothetical protein